MVHQSLHDAESCWTVRLLDYVRPLFDRSMPHMPALPGMKKEFHERKYRVIQGQLWRQAGIASFAQI